jgi:hypothetical protein
VKGVRGWLLGLLLLSGVGDARGQTYPTADLTGFLRFQPLLSIDGRNPNNRNINNSARDLNLFRTWGQLESIADVSRAWRLYGKFRLLSDNEDNLDGRLRNFDHSPARFPGNGWMLRAASDHVSFEAWELYSDLKIGRLWVRLGKQEIVWGETLARRILDVVNPLDLRWHLFLDPFVEEFDNIRVPEWFGRATYELPNPWVQDLSVEAVANPGDIVPTLLPAQGSPYNIVPTYVTVNDEVPRGHWIGGGRLFGRLADVAFSLVYLSKPVDDAIALSTGAVVDPEFGLPTPVAPGVSKPLRFTNRGVHPRVHIAGGSANYFNQTLGSVFRLEATYTADQPYQKAPPLGTAAPSAVKRAGTGRYAVTIERPTVLVPGQDPTTVLSITFFQTIVAGSGKVLDRAARVSSTAEQIALAVSQPFYRKQLFVDCLYVYDLDDASWVQPGIRYIHGDRWRYDVFVNVLAGAEKRPGRLGALDFADEVGLRITYGL